MPLPSAPRTRARSPCRSRSIEVCGRPDRGQRPETLRSKVIEESPQVLGPHDRNPFDRPGGRPGDGLGQRAPSPAPGRPPRPRRRRPPSGSPPGSGDPGSRRERRGTALPGPPQGLLLVPGSRTASRATTPWWAAPANRSRAPGAAVSHRHAVLPAEPLQLADCGGRAALGVEEHPLDALAAAPGRPRRRGGSRERITVRRPARSAGRPPSPRGPRRGRETRGRSCCVPRTLTALRVDAEDVGDAASGSSPRAERSAAPRRSTVGVDVADDEPALARQVLRPLEEGRAVGALPLTGPSEESDRRVEPRPAAPRIASVIACSSTSPSEWPSSPTPSGITSPPSSSSPDRANGCASNPRPTRIVMAASAPGSPRRARGPPAS